MDYEARMHDVLERLLHDERAEPRELPLSLLKAITNNFDDAWKIRADTFFVLYKGVLRSGKVAVKMLTQSAHQNESIFENELGCLMRVKHKNIVRLLGYCSDTQGKAFPRDEDFIVAEVRKRLFCFEYPGRRNLRAYIKDAAHGLGWRKRYKIIKGICEGLSCLCQNLIHHSDLKPENIWLDEKMVPKILLISGSRRLDEKQSKKWVQGICGTCGYREPDYLDGVVTLKTDLYSLGVVIREMLTGQKGDSVVENILESWADRLGTSLEDTRLEQIRVCTEIANCCLEFDPEKRPDAEHIIEMLVETESKDELTELDEMQSEDELTEEDEMESEDEFTASDAQTMNLNILERVLAGSEKPCHLDFSLLQSITEIFSKQRKIGVGGCGEVYKGILRNGIVAVKRLFNNRTIKDKMFNREVLSLHSVRHDNIVRFLGYCSFTEQHVSIYQGKTVMTDIRERLLCFEYISNGSLENHTTDELRGLEWHTRYDIIVGICKGLLYLHKEKDIIHMDLKPANILLDDLMVPKITDFGLSRLDNISKAATTSRLVSPGYCAPEYSLKGKCSNKSDIYSLGVMVNELVTGSKKEPDLTKVLRRWRHRWIKTSKHTPLGYQQVTKCLELAQRCIQNDPTARPDIVYIMDELSTIDSKVDQFQEIPCLDDMLGIEPLEIHFPFELDPHISHSIELTNDTDDDIAFVTKAELGCFWMEPNMGIVPPRSKCSVTIKMQAQVKEHDLPYNHYKEKITVQSTIVDGGLAAMDITLDMFNEKEGTVVDEVNVVVVFDDPPLSDEES